MKKTKKYHFLGFLLVLTLLIGSIQNNFVIPSALEEDEIVQEVEEVEEVKQNEEEPHVHAFGGWEVVKEPTVDAEGEEKRVCECGESESRSIPKIEESNDEETDIIEEETADENLHVHEFGEWETVTEPTEDTEGLEKRYCECGEVEEKTIPKLEKKEPVEKVAGSTVTKSTIYLNVVFDGFSGSATFKATNAEGDVIASKTVTSSTNVSMKVPRGEYATISCELDGENLNRVESTFSTFSGKFSNATYSLSAVFTYTACQHTKTANITLKRASYTDTGTKIKLCLDCGEIIENTTLDKLVCSHTRTTDVIISEASENATGSKEIRCADCGTLIKTEVIPKKEHVHNYEVQISPATCQQEGSKTEICTICGNIKSIQTIVKTSHTFDEGVVTKEPTCVVSGLKTLTCKVCGFEKVESISATGHDYELVSTTPATCAEKGSKKYVCKNCNDTYSSSIAKTAHDWSGSYVITKQPTCTETGIKQLFCKNCGQSIKTLEVPKIAHTYSWVITHEATDTEDGLKEYKCSVCGDVNKTEVIPKTGTGCAHPVEYRLYELISPATCVDKAHYTLKCSLCGEVLSEDYQKPDDQYNPDNHVNLTIQTKIAPTTEETGIRTYYCSSCGYTKEEVIPVKTCSHWNKEVKNIDGKLYWKCTDCGELVGDASPDDCVHGYYGYDYVQRVMPDENTWGETDLVCKNCKTVKQTFKIHPYSEYHVTDQNGQDVTLYGWFDDDAAREVFDLTNTYRQENGLNKLTYNTTCQDASNLRALEALVYWGHTRPNGTKWNTIIPQWKYGGENLAQNQRTPSAVMTAWKNSPGHNANLLYGINSGETPFKGLSVSCFHQLIIDEEHHYASLEKVSWAQNFTFYQY